MMNILKNLCLTQRAQQRFSARAGLLFILAIAIAGGGFAALDFIGVAAAPQTDKTTATRSRTMPQKRNVRNRGRAPRLAATRSTSTPQPDVAATQSERWQKAFSFGDVQEIYAHGWLSAAGFIPPDEDKKDEGKRADQPDKATEYYLKKRLPAGETDLPIERYFDAMAEMQEMDVYATADQRQLTRTELRRNAKAQQKLGTWTELGPGNIGGRTRAILIHPQEPNTMYAAGVAGGVWKTTNAGQSWTPISDLMANIAVTALAFDPKDPNTIYAGTGEGFQNADAVRGAGIFKTTDAGATWARLAATGNNNANFYFVNDLIVSPNEGKRLYAATSTGVWRSLDAGATWTRVVVTTGGGGCHDLAVRTDQTTDFLLAACGNFTQATIFRKTDAEADGAWETALRDTGMGRTALAFAPSNQSIVYAVAAAFAGTYQDGLHAVFRSENGGAAGSWQARVRNTDNNPVNTGILSNPVSANAIVCRNGTANSFGGQSWYDLAIAVDPLDPQRVWVGGIDVARSDDGGANWGYAAFSYEGAK